MDFVKNECFKANENFFKALNLIEFPQVITMNEASTITMTGLLTSNVNIQLAYELLPVLHPKNEDGSNYVHPKNTRNKIPYFGVEKAIVCVKYKGKIRGIRQNEGQMNNVASIDLQSGNKNVNIKLAKTKVQLTGANSDAMGKRAFEILCDHINMIQKYLEYIRSIDDELRQRTINWIIEKTNGERLNLIDIKMIEENKEIIDASFASFLWQFADDYNVGNAATPDEINASKYYFYEKFKRLIEICYSREENICDTPVAISECNISNSVYNYSLNKEVSLIALTKHLYKKGFSVSFHNWNSTQLKVSIPIINDTMSETSDESENSIHTVSTSSASSKKIKAHRFTVHRKLSIKQTSPTSYEHALEARESFLAGVMDFPELMEETA